MMHVNSIGVNEIDFLNTPSETPCNNYAESNLPSPNSGSKHQKFRIKPSTPNSVITSSSYRSQTANSIYDTAVNSINTDITRSGLKEVDYSHVYSGTNFDCIARTGTIRDIYSDPTKKPLLSPQNSILAIQPTIWQNYPNENSTMQVGNNVGIF